jgi:hypothetical protein
VVKCTIRLRIWGSGVRIPPSAPLYDFARFRRHGFAAAVACSHFAASKGREDLLLSKPIIQNGLVLHRRELGDLAEAHHLRFAERLVGQEFV